MKWVGAYSLRTVLGQQRPGSMGWKLTKVNGWWYAVTVLRWGRREWVHTDAVPVVGDPVVGDPVVGDPGWGQEGLATAWTLWLR